MNCDASVVCFVQSCFVFFFAKIHHKFIFTMIAGSSSIADILNDIISKIETEIEQENLPSYANHSKFQDVTVSDEKIKLLPRDSMEDVNCRICYDPSQELSVIYPCRCKVRNNKVVYMTNFLKVFESREFEEYQKLHPKSFYYCVVFFSGILLGPWSD